MRRASDHGCSPLVPHLVCTRNNWCEARIQFNFLIIWCEDTSNLHTFVSFLDIEHIITSAKDVHVFHLCQVFWLVGLCAGFYKNYRRHFHQTWMQDGSRPRIDPNNFWCGSKRFLSLYLILKDRAFFFSFFFLISLGIMHWSCWNKVHPRL